MLTHYSKNLKFKTLYSVTTDTGASKFITDINGWKRKSQYSMVEVYRSFSLMLPYPEHGYSITPSYLEGGGSTFIRNVGKML
jgi:hypothetical protein